MSLDNILAVGALSNGDLLPLVFGLLLSISILLVGSAFISVIAERFEWLLYLAVVVLGWTSATMIHDDLYDLGKYHNFAWLQTLGGIKPLFNQSLLQLILAVLMWLAIAGFYLYFRHRRAQVHQREKTTSSSPEEMEKDASPL